MFVSLNTCNEFSETHALFADVTVMIKKSMHAHRPTLAHVSVVRSAIGGAVISQIRESDITASQFFLRKVPNVRISDSACFVFVALKPAERIPQIKKQYCKIQKITTKTRSPKSKSSFYPVSCCCTLRCVESEVPFANKALRDMSIFHSVWSRERNPQLRRYQI